MRIVHTDGTNKDFIELCTQLDHHLNEMVGGEKQRSQYTQYNTLESIHDVIVIYRDELPVACGSFKLYAEQVAEVKRVFVQKEYRGQGLAKKIMGLLEEKAKSQGFTSLILETGAMLNDAIGLYSSLGYERIENYGQYKHMKESVCMRKHLN